MRVYEIENQKITVTSLSITRVGYGQYNLIIETESGSNFKHYFTCSQTVDAHSDLEDAQERFDFLADTFEWIIESFLEDHILEL